jgi:peptidase E
MELLLLSSSRTTAGYFTEYLAEIKDFSAGTRRAVFLPFAAVALPWSEYAAKVSEAIGLALQPVEELDGADFIVVGGGNTFQLLRECRLRGLLGPMRARVREGKARYLGWSAGANLACPTAAGDRPSRGRLAAHFRVVDRAARRAPGGVVPWRKSPDPDSTGGADAVWRQFVAV